MLSLGSALAHGAAASPLCSSVFPIRKMGVEVDCVRAEGPPEPREGRGAPRNV